MRSSTPSCRLGRFLLFFLGLVIALPAGAAHWEFLGPADRGRVMAFASAPTNPRIVYAGLAYGQVARSLDGGQTWVPVANGLGHGYEVFAITVDAFDPGRVCAASRTGIYCSADGGTNWRRSLGAPDFRPTEPPITVIAADPLSLGGLYLGTGNGMFHSYDGGLRWSSIRGGLAPEEPRFHIPALVVAPSEPRVVYLASLGARTASAIFRSPNQGRAWVPIYRGRATKLAVDPQDPDVLYAVLDSPEPTLLRTLDGGRTWGRTRLTHPVRALVVDPNLPRVVYALTDAGLERSGDRGVHFKPVAGLPAVGSTLAGIRGGALLLGTEWDGVFLSTDHGESWTPAASGLEGTRVWVVAAAGSTLYVGSGYGLDHSTDRGASWNRIYPSPISALAIAPSRPTTFYAGTTTFYAGADPFVVKSTDGGETWQPAGAGIRRGPIVTLAVDPRDPDIVYAGAWTYWDLGDTPGLFRSTDGGGSWQTLPLPSGVNGVAVDLSRPGRVYATQRRDVWRSDDHGQTWTTVLAGLASGLGARWLHGIRVAPTDPDYLVTYDDIRVFVSRDAGRSWKATGGFGGWGPEWSSLVFSPQPSPQLFLGGTSGVYTSRDDGATWKAMGQGLERNRVNDLAWSEGLPDRIYAATDAGLFVIDVP